LETGINTQPKITNCFTST